MSVSEFIKKLNQNKLFKFISSIRLAVPLMLIMGACVAYGTIIESNYNAEYASMAIYKSTWFGLLLILLWINIFAATISRIPFKQHHTGFVITHIGLLTLLIGGYVTNSDGIDGQLVIPENQSSSSVTLPHLMLGYQFDGSPTPQVIKFKKTISSQDESDLKYLNESLGHLFRVKAYIPFAKIEREFIESTNPEDQGVALSFILKSNFFNVTEWLHSETNPTMKMGPATIKIVKVDDLNQAVGGTRTHVASTKKPEKASNSPSKNHSQKGAVLVVTDSKDPSNSKRIEVKDLVKKSISVGGVQISLSHLFQHAVVSENKVIENPSPTTANPAIEFFVEKDGKKVREVLYAKFAGFALNKDGIFGYRFSFEADGVEATPSEATPEMSPAQAAMKGDNTVIFSVDPKQKGKARVTLIKNNSVVMSELLAEGQSIQTPWMGMKVFLGSVRSQAVESIVAQPINAEKSQQLPPSAMLIATTASPPQEFWLAEGEQKQIQINNKNAVVYFGRQSLELPFDLKLEKFSKIDYPGTSTPMSYESLVQIGKTGVIQKISMNEPLKIDGFTVYQASYSITPEQTLSIFSVNRDPGRALKYAGSLILGLGIIIITLMRSRLWKSLIKRNIHNA